MKRTRPLKAPAKKPVARKAAAKPKPAAKSAARSAAKRGAVTSGKSTPAVKTRPAKPTLLKVVLDQLDDAKAEQVVTIGLEGKSAVADSMVVASGRSSRHVGAIADQLVEKLKGAGHRGLRVEGMPQCDWVLVDAGDVVIHLFRPEVRSFYNLEKLWSDHTPAERVAI